MSLPTLAGLGQAHRTPGAVHRGRWWWPSRRAGRGSRWSHTLAEARLRDRAGAGRTGDTARLRQAVAGHNKTDAIDAGMLARCEDVLAVCTTTGADTGGDRAAGARCNAATSSPWTGAPGRVPPVGGRGRGGHADRVARLRRPHVGPAGVGPLAAPRHAGPTPGPSPSPKRLRPTPSGTTRPGGPNASVTPPGAGCRGCGGGRGIGWSGSPRCGRCVGRLRRRRGGVWVRRGRR